MIKKYFAGVIEAPTEQNEIDDALKATALHMVQVIEDNMEHIDPNGALEGIMQVVRRANKYIDETMPWVLAKDSSQQARLATVLYTLAETLRMIGVALQPFMPDTAQKIMEQLGLGDAAKLHEWVTLSVFGQLPCGTQVQPGSALFPRLDLKAEPEVMKYLKKTNSATKETAKSKKKTQQKATEEKIAFDDFAKVELRIAEIVSAERVPKSKKLLKLQVSLGVESRQIIAGIGKYYNPEVLVGKKVTIVANLKPARIFGLESQGMVLAVEDEQGLGLLVPDKEMKTGSRIR